MEELLMSYAKEKKELLILIVVMIVLNIILITKRCMCDKEEKIDFDEETIDVQKIYRKKRC